ncbi:MAG: L,D-transpeptidase [Deltaproteobacteria bacterium]|nr:L,D-transpeptidase [Deltaproteobacteria bacterium]
MNLIRSSFLALCVWVAACHSSTPTDAASTTAPSLLADASDSAQDAIGETDAYEAQDASADVTVEEPFTPPTQIMARGFWVPIRRAANRHAPLAGYLRAGSIVALKGTRVSRETCPVRRELRREGGWYELQDGGFVCVGGALAIPWQDGQRELRQAQPDLDAGMPYRYAIVYGRSAVFREFPSSDELHDNRGWRLAFEARDGGTGESSHRRRHSDDDDDRPRRPGLGDLRGDRQSNMIRRLMTGMYVSLDRLAHDRGGDTNYWRTQAGGLVPAGPLSIVRAWSEFRGVVLDGTTAHLPYAFMSSTSGFLYRVLREGRAVEFVRRIPRHQGIQLAAAEPITIGENRYWRTEADPNLAVKEANVGLAVARPRPTWFEATERWIDIDLNQQILVAYDGETPAFATLVSTGKRDHGELERYHTPNGQYRVYSKHVTTTMDGDTAMAGPYSIEDVPWVMYFWDSYAIHGAFWHGQWGWRMSHGCVNMAPNDARWLFFFANPQLPSGWHGVFSGREENGSPVIIHAGDRPPRPYRPRRRRDNDDY